MIKKIIKLLTIILLAFAFTQCATKRKTSRTMQTWVGHHKSELYQHPKWGPPTRITEDGLGGEILIYDTQVNLGGQTYHSYPLRQQGGYGYVRSRIFFVDRRGIIYTWQAKGL